MYSLYKIAVILHTMMCCLVSFVLARVDADLYVPGSKVILDCQESTVESVELCQVNDKRVAFYYIDDALILLANHLMFHNIVLIL